MHLIFVAEPHFFVDYTSLSLPYLTYLVCVHVEMNALVSVIGHSIVLNSRLLEEKRLSSCSISALTKDESDFTIKIDDYSINIGTVVI